MTSNTVRVLPEPLDMQAAMAEARTAYLAPFARREDDARRALQRAHDLLTSAVDARARAETDAHDWWPLP